MGTPKRVLAPWALLLLALQLAGASHVIHRSLEAEAAPPSVPASIVSPLLRTGYHFQPPMNWINGMATTSLELAPARLFLCALLL
jgi:beta-fructofuranosidase